MGGLATRSRGSLSPKVHDTDIGITGKYAYMETKSSNIVTMADIATNTIFRELRFTDIVGPHAVNGTDTYVIGNVNQWFGFEMVSVATGNVVARVHAEGVADPPAQDPRRWRTTRSPGSPTRPRSSWDRSSTPTSSSST